MSAQTVKKSLAWMGGMSFVGQLLTWSATIIIARLLSPQDYGLVAITGVFTVIAHSVCLMGVSSAVIQADHVSDYQIRALYGFSIYAGCSMYLLGLLAAPVMTMIFREPRITELLAVQNLVFIAGAPKSLQLSLLARDMRFDVIAKIEVGSRIVTSICALFMAALGCGVWTLAIQWLLIEFFQLLGFYLYPRCRIIPTFVIRWDEIRDFLVFGVKVLLQNIIWQLYNSVDVFILGRLSTQSFLGVYTFSKNLTNMPFEKIISIINRVLLPYLAKSKNDHENLRKWTLEAADLQLLLIAPVFYLLFFCGEEVVQILLGDGWSGAIFPLKIFCVFSLFKLSESFVSVILTAMGRVNEQIYFFLIQLFMIGCGILGVSLASGVQASLYVWITVYPLLCLGFSQFLLRAIGLEMRTLFLYSKGILLAQVFMVAALYAAGMVGCSSNLLGISGKVAVGVAVYTGSLWFFAREKIVKVIMLFPNIPFVKKNSVAGEGG